MNANDGTAKHEAAVKVAKQHRKDGTTRSGERFPSCYSWIKDEVCDDCNQARQARDLGEVSW